MVSLDMTAIHKGLVIRGKVLLDTQISGHLSSLTRTTRLRNGSYVSNNVLWQG